MKLSKAQAFILFKHEFAKWIVSFGLNHYDIVFKHCKLNNEYAEITVRERETKIADVSLCTSVVDRQEIIDTAKHEAIHLLLSRLEWCKY